MNKKTLLVLCLALAAVLVIAGILYNTLADDLQAGGLATMPPETEAPAQPPAETVTEATAEVTETQATDPEAHPAPDFTMLDMEGNEVSLASFFGKPIVLNFWASWCGPCKMEMPDFNEAYAAYKDEIEFLMVNMTDGSRETVEKASSFIAESGYTFPVYYDTQYSAAITYSVSSLPTTYFINEEGELVTYAKGAINGTILEKGISMIFAK